MDIIFHSFANPQGAHGVVVSHPLRMRKALGSNPSVSRCFAHHASHSRLGSSRMEASMAALDKLTAVGFEPTPFRTGALSQRLRPLGQTVLRGEVKAASR